MDSCIYSGITPVVCAYIDTLSIFFLNGSCALHWRQKKYFNYPDITYRNKYIREYTHLRKENPSLNVEVFAKAVKTFIAAQEKREAEQEHCKTKEEIETIKNQYGI